MQENLNFEQTIRLRFHCLIIRRINLIIQYHYNKIQQKFQSIFRIMKMVSRWSEQKFLLLIPLSLHLHVKIFL